MRYGTLKRAAIAIVGLFALFAAMEGTWMTSATAAPPSGQLSVTATAEDDAPPKKRPVTGKLNLNTATEQQLMMLPTVGPSKAERIVPWRKTNGGF